MTIVYSQQSKEQLWSIKEFISRDTRKVAMMYLNKFKNKIEILATYPYIGTVNATTNNYHIRDYVVLGHKVIYKINKNSITILAIYKYIDFDEKQLVAEDEEKL